MITREEQLDRVRSIQRSIVEAPLDPARQFRIILEFAARPDPAAVAAAIREQLDIDVSVTGLLEDHGLEGGDNSLDRFLAVRLQGLGRDGLPGSPFEISYAIGDAVGALTAEPETQADFFRVPRDGDPTIESVEDFPPGCWVPAAQDPTPSKPHWALEAIRAPAAWNLAPPAGGKARGEGVSVFQPDTGVADHVEIEPGMLDLTRAHDFVANVPGATDPLNYSGNPGHGTGTASVVASRFAGTISGSAPLATLVPASRAVEAVVVFDHGRVAAAVEHARRNGAQVITMSLGGPWSSVLRAAIDAAIHDGVVVTAAAGNCVKIVVWPARYEEVIAVAGSNISDMPWIGSSRGGAVDITAPGEFVPRANRFPGNGGSATHVQGGQGTSFAVAMTAGVAALWLAYHGPAKIRQTLGPGETVQARFVAQLKASARLPAGFDTSRYGAGIVDAERLLRLPLAASAEEAPEALAPVDPLRSLKTALAEAPLPFLPIEELPVAAPAIEDRRYAAELSHLVLKRSLEAQTGTSATESVGAGLGPSPTLAAALGLRAGTPR